MKWWQDAPPYRPLNHNYITHEDRQYLEKRYRAYWVTGFLTLDPKTDVSMLNDRGETVGEGTIEQMHRDADRGCEYAQKFLREMSKAKVLGRWAVIEKDFV